MRSVQIGDATLIHGDCLEVMAEWAANSVDAVITDPPYGTTRCSWDSVIPLPEMWNQLKRICAGPMVFTACQPFTSALIMSNPKMFRHEWVWEKNKGSGHLNAKRRPMRAHEDIVVFCAKQPTYNPQMTDGHEPGHYAKRASQSDCYNFAEPTVYGGSTKRYPRSVQKFSVINNDNPEKTHPTQKPVELMEYLILTYTKNGEELADFCMGSGTTGVAAINTGRKFIGIEKEEKYFDSACERIQRAWDARAQSVEVAA